MRTYERTHPWLTFQMDLRRASPHLWMLLGEAQSKCEHIAGVPLLPSTASRLYQLYLAKGVLATTAIEGNTLTEDEVLRHFEGDLRIPHSKEYLAREIDNIVVAINEIGQHVLSGTKSDLTVEGVKRFNRIVLEGLPVAEAVIPGEFRTYQVGVGRYRAAPHEDIAHLVERLSQWLEETSCPPGVSAAGFGMLKAILAHAYIAMIHPFGDGNGRTARLAEFQILLEAGLPATAAHLFSNHYNQTRAEYYRQLDVVSQSGGDLLGFIEYALQGFVDALREQIETIRTQQLQVHWIHYVHSRFGDRETATDRRRRRLVIDLSASAQPVPLSKLRHISPRVAESYASKTEKTVNRDVNHLLQLGLVERTREGVRARTEIMRAFLAPKRASSPTSG